MSLDRRGFRAITSEGDIMKGISHLIAIILMTLILLAAEAWAQLPPIIDLNVTPGTESAKVTRIYGDDAEDHLGSTACIRRWKCMSKLSIFP